MSSFDVYLYFDVAFLCDLGVSIESDVIMSIFLLHTTWRKEALANSGSSVLAIFFLDLTFFALTVEPNLEANNLTLDLGARDNSFFGCRVAMRFGLCECDLGKKLK